MPQGDYEFKPDFRDQLDVHTPAGVRRIGGTIDFQDLDYLDAPPEYRPAPFTGHIQPAGVVVSKVEEARLAWWRRLLVWLRVMRPHAAVKITFTLQPVETRARQ